MAEKKPMNKWLLYSIFTLKFLLGLGFIIWTVYMTLQSTVGEDDDNAFLSTYHNVDDNYNDIVNANDSLNSKYDIEFIFNDTIINGISHKDVFLAQRAISQRKTRKDILKIGTNSFTVNVKDKTTGKKVDANIEMLVTMATNHDYDKSLKFKNGSKAEFELNKIGFWNITGSINIDEEKGSFFIKTNAK